MRKNLEKHIYDDFPAVMKLVCGFLCAMEWGLVYAVVGTMELEGGIPLESSPDPARNPGCIQELNPPKANLASPTFQQILCYCPRLHWETFWPQWPIICSVADMAGITGSEF